MYCVFKGTPPPGYADWAEWMASSVYTNVFVRTVTESDWCRKENVEHPDWEHRALVAEEKLRTYEERKATELARETIRKLKS